MARTSKEALLREARAADRLADSVARELGAHHATTQAYRAEADAYRRRAGLHANLQRTNPKSTLRKTGRGEAEAAAKRGARYLAEGRLDLAKAAVAQARHHARSAFLAKWAQDLLGGDVAHLQASIDRAERHMHTHVNPRLASGIETCDAPVGAGAFFRVRSNGKTHYVRAPKGTRTEAVAVAIDRSGWLGMTPYTLSPVRPRKNPLSQSQAANARYAGREVARLVRLREELSAAITEAQHAIGVTKKRAQGRVVQLLAEVRKQEQATAAWRRAARMP